MGQLVAQFNPALEADAQPPSAQTIMTLETNIEAFQTYCTENAATMDEAATQAEAYLLALTELTTIISELSALVNKFNWHGPRPHTVIWAQNRLKKLTEQATTIVDTVNGLDLTPE